MTSQEIQHIVSQFNGDQRRQFEAGRVKHYDTQFTGDLPANIDQMRYFVGCICNPVDVNVSAACFKGIMYPTKLDVYTIGNLITIVAGYEKRANFMMWSQVFGTDDHMIGLADWIATIEAMEALNVQLHPMIEKHLTTLVKSLAMTKQLIQPKTFTRIIDRH